MFSIQIASTGPSKTTHFLSEVGLDAASLHARQFGERKATVRAVAGRRKLAWMLKLRCEDLFVNPGIVRNFSGDLFRKKGQENDRQNVFCLGCAHRGPSNVSVSRFK